ncbi:MAG: hypothetical protein JXR97_12870 [Planctomycetes bacterium]|nr:hypothetical protein [Planctomycetota bacterium]
MKRIVSVFVMFALFAIVAGGCREWRQQANTYKQQKIKAGTLIGSDMAAVEKELGKPSFKADVKGQKESVWTYSYNDDMIYTPGGIGFQKSAYGVQEGPKGAKMYDMKLYFKDGKLEAVQGN